jgi:hypothetical protein
MVGKVRFPNSGVGQISFARQDLSVSTNINQQASVWSSWSVRPASIEFRLGQRQRAKCSFLMGVTITLQMAAQSSSKLGSDHLASMGVE